MQQDAPPKDQRGYRPARSWKAVVADRQHHPGEWKLVDVRPLERRGSVASISNRLRRQGCETALRRLDANDPSVADVAVTEPAAGGRLIAMWVRWPA